MKVAITVTAVFDLPDDQVEIEDYMGEDGTLMPHFIVKDRKFRPFIDFDFIEDGAGNDSWNESDEEELGEVYDIFDDALNAEQYTIIDLDSVDDDD